MDCLNTRNDPPRPGPDMSIVRLRAGQKVTVVVLSKQIWGCYTHWAGRYSTPCYADKSRCPGHKQGLPLRWKGYLHVWDYNIRDDYFLELTPTACHNLLDQVGRGMDLRCQRLMIERGKGDKARLYVSVQTPHDKISDKPLPEAKDPFKTLCRLWGIEDGNLHLRGEDDLPFSVVA